ncbi:MAG: hypothetical protein PHC88_04325 [Terrimicrobiaceae bacterium]|nr:hypothetical protein [Terrimicrobiaceae bacterium]
MDAFDLLGLRRRPWLDPAAVRESFQERARALHPDAPRGDSDAFARLNAAHRELNHPASRLRLLVPAAAIPATPPDIELGFRIGAFLREGDALLRRHREAKGPLACALLAGEIAKARREADELSGEVEARIAASEALLCALDAGWPDVAEEDIAALAGAFTFLDRWSAQLLERRVALQIMSGGHRSVTKMDEVKAPPSNSG